MNSTIGLREIAAPAPAVCTGPITYVGQAAVQSDIAHFKAALQGMKVEEAFIPAVAPGTIELQRRNEDHPTAEAYLYAIAEAMREEYRAIVDACFLLEIHDPRVVTQYDMLDPTPSIAAYRTFATLRIAALNHALAGLPPERIRYHLCWGSWHGPHTTDVPLKDIVDLVFTVRAGAYSVEAANPRHEHEWQVWETVQLPEDKVLIPGVVAHTTNTVEHPGLGGLASGELCQAGRARERYSGHRLRLLPGRLQSTPACLHSSGPSSVPWPRARR